LSLPEMAVLAEGDLPTGEHWTVRAGGTDSDYYTFLETVHPDGHRDEGGMGGPPLHPGSLVNTYTGGSDRGLRRVVVRADPRVAHVDVVLADGERLRLSPVATLPDPALSFFAALLPRTAQLLSITAVDAGGQVLEPQDLAFHEAGWQRFLRKLNSPET
jgi:hypothetical protein